MAVVMGMSGLLNIVDAVFLGRFVGPEALAAVSLSFPVVMVLIALASLIGGGMSSLFARHLGAKDKFSAAAIFTAAHGLALSIAGIFFIAFLFLGPAWLRMLAGRNSDIAQMAYVYLLILIGGSPIQFLMSLHADAARNEGRAGFMAILSVCVTFANIVLNYILIVGFGLGVAGSAWGTVAAQILGLLLLLELRRRDNRLVPLSALGGHSLWRNWPSILALGLPLSLSFIGMALVSAAVIVTLKLGSLPGYADSIAAYGIVTRIFGFAFMPLMALALATQTIIGTNTGAGLHCRANAALRLAIVLAFGYCFMLESALFAAHARIGFLFVDDPDLVKSIGTILRPMLVFYLFSGPILIMALYFQAIGNAGRTAALLLLKPFFFAPLFIILFAALLGTQSLWFAFPAADLTIMTVAVFLFVRPRLKEGSKGGTRRPVERAAI
ncbi:MATE family efflux transporter [Altericroceibacterium spongiae]|uniref:Multidrug export protein MepA n=2 Tax=Altericroceibacterium spongiae TaxID=2320269 RepID=A0A420ESH1_9SPHN|nr:MATE family efflux transporter [Altericroceibacterium spongiae]